MVYIHRTRNPTLYYEKLTARLKHRTDNIQCITCPYCKTPCDKYKINRHNTSKYCREAQNIYNFIMS